MSGREKLGGAKCRCGGGGGVAGARGMTLGDAATAETGASGVADVTGPKCVGASGAADVTGPKGVGASGAADVTGPEGATGAGDAASKALRSGGGGGDRNGPGEMLPGKTPRDDGGGGIRDVGGAPPRGRGTTLTGRGRMLGGETDTGTVSEPLEALGSLSSPIEDLAAHAPRHAGRL